MSDTVSSEISILVFFLISILSLVDFVKGSCEQLDSFRLEILTLYWLHCCRSYSLLFIQNEEAFL